MNRCPKCNEMVMEMATNCRHCGEPIDEKTFFLAENELLDEVKAVRAEAEAKLARQRKQKLLGQWLITVGLLLSGVGVGFMLRDKLPFWVAIGGLAVTGVGIVFLALSQKR